MWSSDNNFSFSASGGFGATTEAFTQKDIMSTQINTTQAKPADTKPKQTLFPITLKMAKLATEDEGSTVALFGMKVVSVLLVVQVISVEKGNASFEFQVTDTTSRMKISFYYDSDDEYLVNDLKSIQPMDYIRVVGSIRLKPEVHISAQHLTQVQDHGEVPCHLMEAVLFAANHCSEEKRAQLCKTTQMAVEGPTSAGTTSAGSLGAFSGENVGQPTVNAQSFQAEQKPAASPELNMFMIRKTVVEWLKKNNTEEGHNLKTIADGCKVSEAIMSTAIEECLDDGEIMMGASDELFMYADMDDM